MAKGWEKLDLGGAGLQSANLKLARALRRRAIAYPLLVLGPLGAHRAYLGDQRGAVLRLLGTLGLGLVAATLWWVGFGALGLIALVPLGLVIMLDAWRMEGEISKLNKALRMSVYLKHPNFARSARAQPLRQSADAGVEANPAERAGTGRIMSFDEQERLLREQARATRGLRGDRESDVDERE